MNFSLKQVSTRLHTGNARFSPMRDWLTMLALALIALIISVGYGISSFDATKNAPAPSGSAETSPVPAATLIQAQQVEATRAAAVERYANGTYSFIDPSK